MEMETEMERVVTITSHSGSAIKNGGNLWLVWAIGRNVKVPDLPKKK